MILDDFAATWSKKRADPKDKELRFQALLEYLEPMFGAQTQQAVLPTQPIHAQAPTDLKSMSVAEFNAPIKKDEAQQQSDFDRRVNATIKLIREACDATPSGQSFTVNFPPSGEWELQDLNGLCKVVGLPCQISDELEEISMGLSPAGISFKFVRM
jgi:hypothetical protein